MNIKPPLQGEFLLVPPEPSKGEIDKKSEKKDKKHFHESQYTEGPGEFQPVSRLIRQKNWLIVRFPVAQTVLSWAIVGGGKRRAQAVAWYQVTRGELKPPVDPRQFLKERLGEAFLPDAVGLLTSGNLDHYVEIEKRFEKYFVRSIATVGLSNALSVGDPPGRPDEAGTINLLCQVSHPLSEEAMIEAVSLAAEARTAAVLEGGIPSTRTGLPSTGTGTDCIVIAAPESGIPLPYAGKHTPLGHLIGRTVLETIRLGVERWRQKK